VGAQSKHVLAEGGLVPDEPHEDGQEHCVDYVVGSLDLTACNAEQGRVAYYEVPISVGQAGNGHALVVALLNVATQDGVEDQLSSQGNDEGMQLELGYKEAVEGTDESADGHYDQDDHGDGQGADVGPHFIGGIGSLQERSCHTGGDTNGTACRK